MGKLLNKISVDIENSINQQYEKLSLDIKQLIP